MSTRIKLTKYWPLGLFPMLLMVISLIPSLPLAYGSEEEEELPLCSEVENNEEACYDDEDRPETTEEFREAQEDKGVGCQPEDDYCDYDQNCEWTSIDCIDDTKFDEDDYDG